MEPKGRILALDVGDRRIGVAVTDALGLTAQPLLTVHRTSPRADAKSIARLVRRHEAGVVVVGLPLNADGSDSTQAAKARAFAEVLVEVMPGVPLHWMDERLTTRAAHELLDQSGRSRRSVGQAAREERKGFIDQVAAVLLLEAFLARENGPALLPDPEDE